MEVAWLVGHGWCHMAVVIVMPTSTHEHMKATTKNGLCYALLSTRLPMMKTPPMRSPHGKAAKEVDVEHAW